MFVGKYKYECTYARMCAIYVCSYVRTCIRSYVCIYVFSYVRQVSTLHIYIYILILYSALHLHNSPAVRFLIAKILGSDGIFDNLFLEEDEDTIGDRE